jgi:hypothetical protein
MGLLQVAHSLLFLDAPIRKNERVEIQVTVAFFLVCLERALPLRQAIPLLL